MASWKEAIQQKITQEVGLRSGFCVVGNQEYRDGPDQPNSQHAGEILWDYDKQTYSVLNVSTDQDLPNLKASEIAQALELLGVTNSDWQ